MGTVPPENKGAVELACMPAHIHLQLYRSWPYDDCVETNASGAATWNWLTNNGSVRHSSGTYQQMACLLMAAGLFMHLQHCNGIAATNHIAPCTMANAR